MRTTSTQPSSEPGLSESGASSQRSWIRSSCLRAVLVLGSLAVGALLFALGYEVFATARYYIWRSGYDNFGNFERITVKSPNPILMWEYKPYGKRPNPPLVETNRYGYRERDFESKTKPEGTIRVAFIGDSVTLGLYVSNSRIFVSQFERLANTRFKDSRLQALNFGIDGYNTLQIGELLRTKVPDFDPDLVVYSLCLNDFDFEDSSGQKILYFNKPKSFLIQRLREIRRKQLGIGYYRYHYLRTRNRVLAEIVAMRDHSTRNDVQYVVALLPIFDRAPARWRFDEYPLVDIHDSILEFLRANDVEVIDVLRAFQAYGRSPSSVSVDPLHPDETGHRVIAEALVEPVFKQLIESDLILE